MSILTPSQVFTEEASLDSEAVPCTNAFVKATESNGQHKQRFGAEAPSEEKETLVDDFEDMSDVVLIVSPSDRICCFHLGVDEETDLHKVVDTFELLIGYMHFQTLIDFLHSIGYIKIGEESFDQQGNRQSCEVKTWQVKNNVKSFTSEGLQFFTNPMMAENSKEKQVVVNLACGKATAGLSYITSSYEFSQRLHLEHYEYTKRHNMLRGAKLRNVNVNTGKFEEVEFGPEHSWDNYYYPPSVRLSFDRYIKRFLEKNAQYNDRGITRRGILYTGEPGTGKTSLGKIACNELRDFSFLWITSDVIVENNVGMSAIKKLYQLADYLSPCAAFLEDLDLFGEDRDGRSETVALGAMMNVLDGVNSMDNICTIATTNRPELIEKALMSRPGRFDAIVNVPRFDDLKLRMGMLTSNLSEFKVDEGVIKYLAEDSDGWTGATMQELLHVINIIFIEKESPFPDHVTMDVAKSAMEMIKFSTPAAKKRRNGTGFNSEKP